ncbi:MAG: hypothetical protein M3530_08895 [Thermoproteota archaeon]|nr:hypothetical protein [Thermoproteota archaeon]
MSCNTDGLKSPLELFLACTQDGGRISKCHDFVTIFMNGIEYYFVDVILKDKSERRIDGYGQDAITLYRNVMKTKQLKTITNLS